MNGHVSHRHRVERPIGFQPSEISTLLNEDVITQHADDAAFLWTLRDRAVLAPHYSLEDLASLDERVDANLEGLHVAGDMGWRLCEEALGREEAGELFAASILAFETGHAERIASVTAVAARAPQACRGLVSALGWQPLESMLPHLRVLVRAADHNVRRVGIAGYAVHREDPGPALLSAMTDLDAQLRARAFEAAAELGRAELAPTLRRSIADPSDACRFAAAWSAARLGDRSDAVLRMLWDVVESGAPLNERALGMWLRCQDVRSARRALDRLRSKPDQLRLVTIGMGMLGDPALVGLLVDLMSVDDVARVAGESLSMITGVDLSYEDLDRDEPADFERGPTDAAHDDEVMPDPDLDLPWPDPALVARWWATRRADFKDGERYLCGRTTTKDGLLKTLARGNQPQRAAAALELALHEPTLPIFEVRANGRAQRTR